MNRHESDPAKALALVARSLVSGSFVVLAVGIFLNSRGRVADGPEVLSWVAAAYAVLATLGAVWLRGQGLVAPSASEPRSAGEKAALSGKTLVFFAVLESAVVFCAVALMAARPAFPFAAGLLPFAVMLFNLPRRSP